MAPGRIQWLSRRLNKERGTREQRGKSRKRVFLPVFIQRVGTFDWSRLISRRGGHQVTVACISCKVCCGNNRVRRYRCLGSVNELRYRFFCWKNGILIPISYLPVTTHFASMRLELTTRPQFGNEVFNDAPKYLRLSDVVHWRWQAGDWLDGYSTSAESSSGTVVLPMQLVLLASIMFLYGNWPELQWPLSNLGLHQQVWW